MWLEQFTSINYRSCQNVTINLAKDEPNILIGINDCGKSSILKAIGLLLPSKQTFNFPSDDKKKNDFSNSRLSVADFNTLITSLGLPHTDYTGNQTVLIAKFKLEAEDLDPAQVSGYSKTLQWVFENLVDEYIWVMKIFDEEAKNSIEYILTKDLADAGRPLQYYTATAKALNEKKTELKLTKEEIDNENGLGRFKNSELVSAIYRKVGTVDMWVNYVIASDKLLFPEFSYLDWNVSMEQLQSVAKTAISTKISPHTDLAAKFARRQAAKAQAIVDTELDAFTKLFAVDLPNIEAFKSNIIFSLESKLTDLFINKANTNGDIHLDSQGDGIKRQIWFALIKWTALNVIDAAVNSKKHIWCFDEPETHLYPRAQRDFFEIIQSVSKKNVQSLISTHSTVFIDRADFSKIAKFELDGGYSKFSHCTSTGDIYERPTSWPSPPPRGRTRRRRRCGRGSPVRAGLP